MRAEEGEAGNEAIYQAFSLAKIAPEWDDRGRAKSRWAGYAYTYGINQSAHVEPSKWWDRAREIGGNSAREARIMHTYLRMRGVMHLASASTSYIIYIRYPGRFRLEPGNHC